MDEFENKANDKSVEEKDAGTSDEEITTDTNVEEITTNTNVEEKTASDENGFTDAASTKLDNPLPVYGIGPKWSIPCAVITLIAIIIGHIHPISTGIPQNKILRYAYIGIGAVVIVFGIKMWVDAIVNANIDEHIMSGKLQTGGVYKHTRNPIYAAILFIMTGALFISGNAYMYILPIIFWAVLTEMLKRTEEVWLLERFGDEYTEYCKNTHRILPWFNK